MKESCYYKEQNKTPSINVEFILTFKLNISKDYGKDKSS